MKLTYKSADGRFLCEVEGTSDKELWASIAHFQEVFESTNKCEHCGGKETKLIVRVVDDNQYYEAVCKNAKCRAKLGYGQHKKGGSLFPKRKDKEEKYLEHQGWVKYDPSKVVKDE